MNESWIVRTWLVAAAILLCLGSAAWALTPQEELGERLYFDEYLSKYKNQSCASCHFPEPGFVDPDNVANPDYWVVSIGSDPNKNGGRNSPSVAYAAFSPAFYWNEGEGLYMGGQFWDGRAATLTEQAKGPFLNPLEMAMQDEAAVLAAIAAKKNPNARTYRKLFLQVYGVDLLTLNLGDRSRVVAVYEMMAEAIAAYEKTVFFRPFTSKYDYFLTGKTELSAQELRGLALFNGKAQCHFCHPAVLTQDAAGNPMPPLFTDYSYDNLGIPKSKNSLIAGNPVDYGLGGRPDIAAVDPDEALSAVAGYPVSAGEAGKFKVMTLRNIAVTPPYGHNGFFATLGEIVHFYNKRDMMQSMSGGGGGMGGGGMGGGGGGMGMNMQPEVAQNVNTDELGNLGLTMMEEGDLVAFLRTLTDGYGTAFPYDFPPPK